MRVIAMSRGYDNLVVREPGEEFDMPNGSTGSWFTKVGGVAEDKALSKATVKTEAKHSDKSKAETGASGLV